MRKIIGVFVGAAVMAGSVGALGVQPVSAAPDPGPRTAATPHAVPTAVRELKIAAAAPATTTRAGQRSITTKATATRGFSTIGVTWAPGAEPALDVAVRTRGAGGWSGWQELERSDDAENHATGVRPGTDPLYVGPSSAVQARVSATRGALPADLRLELVDPGSSDYDAAAQPAAVDPRTAAATGGVARPAVLTRAQWGADESKVRASPTYMPTVKAAVLHHTAGPNTYSRAAVPSILRGDYAYHLKRGWNDIGYNVLVDRFGRLWEGRAGGLDRAVMGAHAGGFNTDTFGVSVIGNFDTARPTAASVSAVARVVAWKLDLYHRDPLGTTKLTSAGGGTARYRAGRSVTLPVVMGHRNTGYTACPGKYLYPYLPSIRAEVARLMKVAVLNPSAVPATVTPGSAVSITARALAAQDWQLAVTSDCLKGQVARITGSARARQLFTASWDVAALGRPGGVRPGRYTLTLTSGSAAGTARPVVKTVVVLPPRSPAEPAATPVSGAGGFTPVRPARLWDSTAAPGFTSGLGPDGRVVVPVLGRADVPATGVTAVMLSLTAACETDPTGVSAWPTGARSNRPLSGLLPGVPRTVTVTARVGANGAVTVRNAAGVSEMAVDVLGYWSPAGAPVQVIASQRVYDSSADARGLLQNRDRRRVLLPSTIGGVPLERVSAVLVDLQAVGPRAAGTLRAFRFTDPKTGPPTVVYRKGENVDNLTVVPVHGRSISAAVSGGATGFTVDVRGLVLSGAAAATGKLFTATQPVLVVDTRETGGVLKAGATRKIRVTGAGTGVPGTATAVLLNLTALAPGTATALQVYPGAPGTQTTGVAVRAPAKENRGNEVMVPVAADGTVTVLNSGAGSTQFRVDTHGWFG